MVELPKTEAELQALLDARANEVTESLNSKHSQEMANQRVKHEADLKKAREQAKLSEEQIAEQKYKEQQENDAKELNELRQFKKVSLIGERLAKEGLPDFFKNDVRLLNAEDGELDGVIKTIKKDFEPHLQKGATHSTIVKTNTGGQQTNAKQEAFEKFGEALGNLVKS